MYDMTEQEAWELDEILTNTTPEISASVEGPFIKHRHTMVVLDHLSAQYLAAKTLSTKQSPTEIIGNLIRREIGITQTALS
jgi:hypothetical protein